MLRHIGFFLRGKFKGQTMIESEILPPEAVDYLNQVESGKSEETPEQRAEREANISKAKQDLLSWCNEFISKSKSWREASYETKWRLYQSNCDSIMEPSIANAKEPWQSKAFVPLTASHKETIHSHIVKVIAGTKPALSVEPRFDLGDIDQSQNIQDIITRELDKSKWELEFDKAEDDAETIGSGFIRLYYETQKARRKLRKAVYEGFQDNIDGINPMGMIGYAKRAITGEKRVVAYEDQEEEVITYRGLKVRHYSYWDIFPDPKALKIPGSNIGCRFKITYGDIVAGVKKGYYLPEAQEKLRGLKVTERYERGEASVQADREVEDASINHTDYGMVHEGFEIFGKFPAKWISAVSGEQFDDPEEMIAGRVMFHPDTLIAVEVSSEYDQEPPILKLDYMHKNGSFYGRGVAEMLLDIQRIANEVVNQRLDNGAILLNKSFGVNEKALVNPKQDLQSKPGMMIRLDGNKVANGDIRNALMELPMNDTPTRAGFSEVNEAERWAQERTSANRVTLGTAGLVKDANKTLGGQELAKESAGEKFSYIGLMQELDFLQSFYHQVWKLAYQNLTPEDVENAIGPERAQSFILISPEEIQRDYTYRPLGVFTMDNRFRRQAAVQAIREQFKGAPWINDEAFFDKICQLADEDPEAFKLTEQDILAQQAAMIQPEGSVIPGVGPVGNQPPPQLDLTGQPMPPQVNG